jgi:hypothetical protein
VRDCARHFPNTDSRKCAARWRSICAAPALRSRLPAPPCAHAWSLTLRCGSAQMHRIRKLRTAHILPRGAPARKLSRCLRACRPARSELVFAQPPKHLGEASRRPSRCGPPHSVARPRSIGARPGRAEERVPVSARRRPPACAAPLSGRDHFAGIRSRSWPQTRPNVARLPKNREMPKPTAGSCCAARRGGVGEARSRTKRCCQSKVMSAVPA